MVTGHHSYGFTLIELAVVAAILVILAVAAFSSFQSSNQISESEIGEIHQVVGALNAGTKSWLADQIAQGQTTNLTPPLPDFAAASTWASVSSPFFGNLIDPPVTHNNWFKIMPECYQYDLDKDSVQNDSDDPCISAFDVTGNPFKRVYVIWNSGLSGGTTYCNATVCDPTPFQ